MQATPGQTSYELLQVHPAAPLDLITAAYWRLAGQAQTRRASDPTAEGALHQLTRAYQVLADPAQRSAYDVGIGVGERALSPKLPHRRRGWAGRSRQNPRADSSVDYYDILRVVPEAEPSIVAEAYATLRNYYIRLVNGGYARPELLDYLEEAYSVTSDVGRRREYDEKRQKGKMPAVAEASGANGAQPALRTETTGRVLDKPPSVPPPATVAKASSAPAVSTGTGPRNAVEAPRGGLLSSISSAGGVIGALGKQFTSLSRREQQQVEEKLAQRVQEHDDVVEAEEALLQRLSESRAAGDGTSRASDAPLARLTLIEGPGSGATFELAYFPLTLGGDSDCDITLPGLASRQVRLLYRDGRFVVYNLASPESSAETAPWWILESGDDLTVGPYKLRFTATQG